MTRSALPYDQSLLASLALPSRKALLALTVGTVGAISGAVIGAPQSALAGCVLALALAWAAIVDLDRFILPDVLTLGLVVVGLTIALGDGLQAALPYLLGAMAGYIALAALAGFYKHVRKRSGLGLGDAKLLAAAGAWLGWSALPFVVLLASLSGLACLGVWAIFKRSRAPIGAIAFGPYLAGAIWVVWLVRSSGRF